MKSISEFESDSEDDFDDIIGNKDHFVKGTTLAKIESATPSDIKNNMLSKDRRKSVQHDIFSVIASSSSSQDDQSVERQFDILYDKIQLDMKKRNRRTRIKF